MRQLPEYREKCRRQIATLETCAPRRRAGEAVIRTTLIESTELSSDPSCWPRPPGRLQAIDAAT